MGRPGGRAGRRRAVSGRGHGVVSAARPVVPPGHHAPPRDDGRLPTTITYLEMKARPADAPGAAPSGAAVIRVQSPTVALYRFLYDSVGRPWLWYERKLIPDDALQHHLLESSNELYLLLADGEPAGFFQLDFVKPGDVELEFFGIRPQFLGRRFGRWLLETAVWSAWRPGIGRVWVNTCTLDHPAALPLYKRAGFVPYRTEEKWLMDPRLIWPELYPPR
jgi:GNAT superfamily N-acetyltransferase